MTIRRHADNFSTLLTNNINNSQTSFDLDSVSGFPPLTGSAEVIITIDDGTNIEKCTVTGTITGTTLNTVARGADGSSAYSFLAGSVVEIRPLASSVDRKADLPSSNGIIVRTAAETTLNRTLTGTTNTITVSNGDGVSGNPTITIADNVVLPGTNGATLPQGSTASRPAAGTFGRIRANTSTGFLEFDDSGAWNPLTKAPNGTITALSIPTWSASNTPTLINNSGVTISSDVITCAGITFGNETLSDYDEGTWTPSMTFATPGDLSLGSVTATGYYTKNGREVTIHFRYSFTPTHTTASGNFRLTGLPFTVSANLTVVTSIGSISTSTNVSYPAGLTYCSINPIASQTYCQIIANGSSTANANLTTTNFATGLSYTLTGTVVYFI